MLIKFRITIFIKYYDSNVRKIHYMNYLIKSDNVICFPSMFGFQFSVWVGRDRSGISDGSKLDFLNYKHG